MTFLTKKSPDNKVGWRLYMSRKRSITFVTGNQGKVRELNELVGKYVRIDSHKMDLTEIQGTPDEITIAKAREAYKILKRPVLIEDTSLSFNALGGMPGPYIKWFSEALGNEGLVSMLKGFSDKSAFAQCNLAICYSAKKDPILFSGICNGTIVKPRGSEGFGWDPIFKPSGKKTFAEMDADEKNRISHRSKAVRKLVKYLSLKGANGEGRPHKSGALQNLADKKRR